MWQFIPPILFWWPPYHAATQQNEQEFSAITAGLIKAAEQGDAKSRYMLATDYLEGKVIQQDYVERSQHKGTLGAPEDGVAPSDGAHLDIISHTQTPAAPGAMPQLFDEKLIP